MGDTRLKILALARRALEQQGGPSDEREYILKLLDLLSASIEKYPSEYNESTERLVQGLFDNRALLALLRQQTDELDVLKKLSINLTSSLDLPDVLDAVVPEAMRLIPNARDVHIFLYKNKKLTFGAALDSEGHRNQDWSKPRTNGLTYTVARDGEIIIVEDMKNHPLFVSMSPDWQSSIIGIPLKVGTTIVGVMNLARSTIGSFSPSELRLLSLLADQAARVLVIVFASVESSQCRDYIATALDHPQPKDFANP